MSDTLAPAATSVVEASDLKLQYRISREPRPALDSVSLSVRPGELFAVMGPSGCGKSTLLHVLGGLLAPDSGTVRVDSTDLYSLSEPERARFRREHLGFVFQFFNLLPSLTAAENVKLTYRLASRRPWARRDPALQERVERLMTSLGLHGLQGHRPEEISGGEQQRVALARALLTEPALLLADEPTGTLDYRAGRAVLELLLRLAEREGRTIVLATHDVRAAAYANRVAIMLDGAFKEVVELGRRTVHDTEPLLERLAAHGL